MAKTLTERLEGKYERRGPDECWPWVAATARGYGVMNHGGKMISAHRAIYLSLVGPIDEGLCVCHSCDNKSCVNPRHLWLGTVGDNTRDAVEKGLLVPPNPWTRIRDLEVENEQLRALLVTA